MTRQETNTGAVLGSDRNLGIDAAGLARPAQWIPEEPLGDGLEEVCPALRQARRTSTVEKS